MEKIVNLKVEKSFNGFFITLDDKNYFYHTKHPLKICEYEGGGEYLKGKEVELSQEILLLIFDEIQKITHKRIGGSICQLIESWGDSEKVQDARKCMMWHTLERH